MSTMEVLPEARADTPEPATTSGGSSKSSRSSGSKDGLLRRTKSKSYKNVFKGSVLVSTLMDHDSSRFSNRAAAVCFAQRLLDAGHIESIVGAEEFEDSVHLFRWSDETVVREAKKMVSTLSSHIPRKKLIELVDLKRGEEGEEGFVMQDVKDKLVERSRPSSSRAGPGRSRGRRRQTLDSSQLAESQERENEAQGGLVLSNSVSSDNLSEVPEATLQRRAGSATSSSEVLSSPRVGSTQSISDSYQTDTEKVRSPERVKSPATLRSPSRARSPERHQGAPSAVPEEEDKEDEDGPSEAAAEGGALASQEEASEVTSTTTDGTDTEGHVVRYDGVEMPALDLENLDFDSVRSLSNAADALSVLDPSLESLSEQGNCYSDNEKQLLEQMRRMQKEHASMVTSYEQQINDLMSKMTELKDIADVLQKQRQEVDDRNAEDMNADGTNSSVPTSPTCNASKSVPKPPPPAPPPPPLHLGQAPMRLVKPSKPAIKPRVKMRPLFWNRVILETNQKGKDKSKSPTFWMTATEPNFDVDEFERYFGKNIEEDNPRVRSLHDAMAAAKGRGALKECIKILDDSRSRAVAIKLRSLHCQMADIRAALYNMDFSKLDTDSLFSLYEIRGTKEELDKINTYMQAHENAVLDEPELFVWQLSTMPHFPERVECLMLRKRFNETLFDIDQQLAQVRSACEALRNNDHLRVVLEVTLAFGNYMNGGTQRGQADGFDLSILPKLKDVKSMDNNLTLLHYLVRVCTHEYEADDAGRNEARFRFPEPSMLNQAAAVSFTGLDADLNNLGFQVATNAKKAELIYLDTEEGLLQPFKDQMDDFFETAEDMLKAQQGKLNEARDDFHRLLRYLSVKDATEQVGPEQFFGMWYRFIEDYRHYWMLEQKRIAKQMFEKVEQRRKARIRSAKRRQSANDGKANMKQKFEQIRRRSENLAGSSQPTVKLLRSQSVSGESHLGKVVEEGGPRSAPPHSDERPRRRRRQTTEGSADGSKDGAALPGRDPAAVARDGSGDVPPQNETMAQRMQRRRRTRVSTDDTAEGRPRTRAQSEDLSRGNERRVAGDHPEEQAVTRRRLRISSADPAKPPLPDSAASKPDGDGGTQRRRRPGRHDPHEGPSEANADGSSFASRRQMYREQRMSSEGGSSVPREPRTRPVAEGQNNDNTGHRGAREHMRRIADRGHESVRKADLLNRS